MKKTTFVFGLGLGVGLFLNTESGRKLRTWACKKAQNAYKDLVGKVDEVTAEITTPSNETNVEE